MRRLDLLASQCVITDYGEHENCGVQTEAHVPFNKLTALALKAQQVDARVNVTGLEDKTTVIIGVLLTTRESKLLRSC